MQLVRRCSTTRQRKGWRKQQGSSDGNARKSTLSSSSHARCRRRKELFARSRPGGAARPTEYVCCARGRRRRNMAPPLRPQALKGPTPYVDV
eukprot:363211-Chlamydomonas_euryale.AAC.15